MIENGQTIPLLVIERQQTIQKKLSATAPHEAIRVEVVAQIPGPGLSNGCPEPPEVVLIDGDEGTESVAQSLEAVGSRLPAARAIVLIGKPNREGVREALRAGASGYVRKDIPPARLIEAIGSVVRGGTVVDPMALTAFLASVNTEQIGPSVADRALAERLSRADRRILREAALGRSNAEIARGIGFSVGTIKNRFVDIYRRIDVTNRAEAAYFAARAGIVK